MLCYHFDMSSVLIRNVDDAIVASLKERARKNRRSLQGELKSILEAAVRPRPGTRRQALKIHIVDVESRQGYSREEIYGDDGR